MNDQALPSLLKFLDRLTIASMIAMALFGGWLWFFLENRVTDPAAIEEAESWKTIGRFSAILIWGYAILHAAWAMFLLLIKPRPGIRLPQSLLLFFSGTMLVILGAFGSLTNEDAYMAIRYGTDYLYVLPYIWMGGFLWVAAVWGRAFIESGKERE